MSQSSLGGGDLQSAIARSLHEHWLLFLIEGIVLLVIGVAAIVIPAIASIAVTLFVGWLLLIGGIVGLVMTFLGRRAPGFWWSLLSAVLALVAGGLLLWWPLQGTVSLTLVMIAFFIVDGIASIMLAIEHRREVSSRWGWLLASGVVDLILAGIILVGLPGTALWAIGLLFGIDMVFAGTSLIAVAIAARNA